MNPWIRWSDGNLQNETGWRWLAQGLGMPALLATPARAPADMALPPSRLSDAALERLTGLLGEAQVRRDPATRLGHAGNSAADSLRLRGGNCAGVPDAVLFPRSEDDVVALLRLCDEEGVTVAPPGASAPPGDRPVVALDLSGMARLLSLDGMSGLAEFEAGVTGTEIERQLAPHGLRFGADVGAASLGSRIARGDDRGWLHDLKLATPRGLAGGLKQIAPGSRGAFGIITRATVLVQPRPAAQECRAYLFPDFAAGLAGLREARRQHLADGPVLLSDGPATRFGHDLARAHQPLGLRQMLDDIRHRLRGFDHQAAGLTVTFAGTGAEVKFRRRQFEALAERLGAIAQPPGPLRRLDDTLLDRGVTLDRLRITASWADLPARYAAVRAALDRAMRAAALRDGAHGLVLGCVTAARPEGATLDFAWLFARGLEDDVREALAVRQAALEAARPADDTLTQEVARAIARCLDPKSILKPDAL